MAHIYQKTIIFSITLLLVFSIGGCTKTKQDRENERGIELMENQKYTDAVIQFSNIIKADKNFLPAYFNRAICYSYLEDYRTAINDLNFVISKQKFEEEAYFNRAILYENQKNYKQSVEDYSYVLTLNPQNMKAFHFRGICKYYQKRLHWSYRRL